MSATKSSFWVGFTFLVSLAGLGVLMAITSQAYFSNGSYILYADMGDASGLRSKSRLQVAGIDIGKIIDIALIVRDDGSSAARLTLRIKKEQMVYANAHLEKMEESLLGDYRLNLNPGTPKARALQEFDIIESVRDQSDLDEIRNEMVMISKNINRLTTSLAETFGSEQGKKHLAQLFAQIEQFTHNATQISKDLQNMVAQNSPKIDHIISNIHDISLQIRQMVAPQGSIQSTASHALHLSKKLESIAESLQSLLQNNPHKPADSGEDGHPSQGTVENSLMYLTDTLAHLDSVVRKIDDGTGTLGKLVNDPKIAESIQTTVDSTGQIITGITDVKALIELRSEYDVPMQLTSNQVSLGIKNTLALRLFPKPDKFYILEGIADPRGNQTNKLISDTINNQTTVTTETVTSYNDLKFTAEFARRYYFLTLRFGIIESTGGLGADLHLFNNLIELRNDAFDFSRSDPANLQSILPRLRFTGIFRLVDHLHVQGGIDDPLNGALTTWFLGGVLRFTDNDLRTFLLLAPKI